MSNVTNHRTWLFFLPWCVSRVGGVNQVVINLAKEMLKNGDFTPLVLINDWSAKAPKYEQVLGLDVVRWRVPPVRQGLPFLSMGRQALSLFKFKREFKLFCQQHNVSVINPHYPDQASIAIGKAVKHMVSKPVMITSFHGADVTQILNKEKVSYQLWQDFLRQNLALISCSSAFGKLISTAFGDVASGRVRVVHNGFYIPEQVSTSVSKTSQTPVILNVAKYETKKGQDILLRAFSELLSDVPDAKLFFAGAKGDALPSLQRLSDTLGVSERVTFLQELPHEKVLELYRQASVFCLPSREEPFGIVVLEAGVFGLPVVASAVGGVAEIITHDVNGLLVLPQDPWLLKDALLSVITNKEHAARMGSALREHVNQGFSWELSYKTYLGVFQEAELSARL